MSVSRYWVRRGASLETVAAVGSWSDLKTLRHYVGTEALASKMLMELKHEDATGRMSELMEQVISEMASWKAAQVPQAAVSQATDGLTMVMLKKPHRWHLPREASGPITKWRICGGESFNPSTMTVQLVSSKPLHQPWYMRCGAKT